MHLSSILRSLLFITISALTVPVIAQTNRIEFKDSVLYPEGTAYDSHAKVFYVSSAKRATIGKVDVSGKYTVLYDDSTLKSTYGMKIDSAHHLLWVCAGDANYSKYSDSSTYKKMIRLVAIDLNDGMKVKDINLSDLYAGKHFANDITIDKDDNKYITDSYSPVIYKVDANDKATVFAQNDLFKSKDIGLNGIVVSDKGYLLTINNSTGALLKVDIKNPSQVTVVQTPQFYPGGDGLLMDKQNNLYLVQNKSVNKAYKLTSTDDWKTATLVSATAAADRFQNPSTSTFSNGELYLLNSKLNELSDPTTKPSASFSLQLAVFR